MGKPFSSRSQHYILNFLSQHRHSIMGSGELSNIAHTTVKGQIFADVLFLLYSRLSADRKNKWPQIPPHCFTFKWPHDRPWKLVTANCYKGSLPQILMTAKICRFTVEGILCEWSWESCSMMELLLSSLHSSYSSKIARPIWMLLSQLQHLDTERYVKWNEPKGHCMANVPVSGGGESFSFWRFANKEPGFSSSFSFSDFTPKMPKVWKLY
jgi:hypothetical protein